MLFDMRHSDTAALQHHAWANMQFAACNCRLGHNLGLGHAALGGSLPSAFRPLGAGTDDDYNDWTSAMSNRDMAGLCYNLPQQTWLGCEHCWQLV
jgi:hypothetical protein